MAVTPIPAGHNQVCPYLITAQAPKVIEFLKATFGAQELFRMMRGDVIGHAEVKIGDSVVMLAGASARHPGGTAFVHVYDRDVDAAYARALKAGGESVQAPETRFYGDRSAGVKDAGGNTWWISTHLEDIPEEEIRARSQQWEKTRQERQTGQSGQAGQAKA